MITSWRAVIESKMYEFPERFTCDRPLPDYLLMASDFAWITAMATLNQQLAAPIGQS